MLCLVVILSLSQVSGYAQGLVLPESGKMIGISGVLTPAILRGMVINPNDPLKFDFLMDTGTNRVSGKELRSEAEKAVKYFLASLTVPEDDLWVNLSPDEKDRIVPEMFGRTVMGRDLLAQDYILKQFSSSLLSPENVPGKEVWARVYADTARALGTIDIDMDNFSRVWIVPAEARVWEHDGKVMITQSRLRVMLDSDYNAMRHAGIPEAEGSQAVVRRVLREILLPVLEKEVNEGANFAGVRQIYAAMILSAWYKVRLKESLLGKVYADKNRVSGIEFSDGLGKEAVYARYLESAKNGVYNFIREEADPVTGEVLPRKYFSGGFAPAGMMKRFEAEGIETGERPSSPAEETKGDLVRISAGLRESSPGLDLVMKSKYAMIPKALFLSFLLSFSLPADGSIPSNKSAGPDIKAVPSTLTPVLSDSIRKRLGSTNESDQLAALADIRSYGQSGQGFSQDVVMFYERLDKPGRLRVLLDVGETLFQINGSDVFESYVKLMRLGVDKSNASFLLFIRRQIERGDNIVPRIVDKVLDEKEEFPVREAMFAALLFNFDKGVDQLMVQAAKGPHEKELVLRVLINVLKRIQEIEGHQEILEKARGKLLHFLQDGSRDQRSISAVTLLSMQPVRSDVIDAVRQQAARETDPDTKAGFVRLLDWMKVNLHPVSSGKETNAVNGASPAQAADASQGFEKRVGGIDLDVKRLGLQIKRDGAGVILPVNQQDWSQLDIYGFTPVIYRIEPANINR
ncbi:MAG: hypothetical protein HQL22_01175 [Candidatus Omnitrophica bacterium]|nr:hypothetical protein [Candidatus Omnitrophota bacterium]